MSEAAKDSGAVTVGCKLPNGLHLDLKDKEGNMVRVTLNGANASRIVGGYGLTPNVSAEFMTNWMRKNAKHAAVLNGSIFIHNNPESAAAVARERRDVASGLGAIDPISNGMLKGADGKNDPQAVAAYNAQIAKNPMRNVQIVE